jgi:hypothetical protein
MLRVVEILISTISMMSTGCVLLHMNTNIKTDGEGVKKVSTHIAFLHAVPPASKKIVYF